MTDDDAMSFPNCFVCGRDNPMGLHVDFVRDGEQGCRAEYTALPDHVGWPGLVHGGLLFTLMDEAVAWALCYAGLRGVTGRAEIRFRGAVTVGSRLVLTARLARAARRVVRATAEIRRAEDPSDLVAELTATMYLTDVNQWQGGGSAGSAQ